MRDLKPKAEATIRNEIRSIERALDRDDISDSQRHELIGAHSALLWAAGHDVGPPRTVLSRDVPAPSAGSEEG